MSPADRMAVGIALALIPDSRPLTRWKVMWGAVLRSRSPILAPQHQARLLRRLGAFQAAMVSLGIAIYAQVRWRPVSVVLLLAVTGYVLWALAASLIRMV